MATATPAVAEKVVADAEELPKAIVRRIVKEKLSQMSRVGGEIQVLKDSLTAFCESSRIFIHYVSATANDVCRESKRQTINPEDVFKALEEIEFSEFAASLRTSLEEFKRKNNKGKSTSPKPKEAKKNKAKEAPMENGEELENGIEVENDAPKRKNTKRKSGPSKPKEAKKSKKKVSPTENGEVQENGIEDENDAPDSD